MIYIGLYLGAIVAANLIITYFGPSASIATAFVFIGLDLTTRDYLHESWQGKGLVWKMGLLIASGSVISWILNRDAGPIALASFVAFAAAGVADAIVYQLLKEKSRVLKVNGSNVVSSGVDSLVFPTLAFGSLMPLIVLGQFAAKVFGGAIWFGIISFVKARLHPAESQT
ncbi:MAG: VUT family protein [Proteobacteria bacterium]|nr:VUT family protein [Pseudomonadota bacterium]